MLNIGSWRDVTWPDEWTSSTEDGQRSAQFEHTMVVTDDGVELLTARLPTSPPLWWEKEGGGEVVEGGDEGMDGVREMGKEGLPGGYLL